MPRSLANILNSDGSEGDFPEFERQMQSGACSARKWDSEGRASADFNPLQRPEERWHIYADVLRNLFGSLDAVTMANFLPWGSRTTKEFVSALGAIGDGLLKRAITFANELNEQIVSQVRPTMILVPFSLGRSRSIQTTATVSVSITNTRSVREERIAVNNATFRFFCGFCGVGGRDVRVAHVPHPAALRLSRQEAHQVVERMSRLLSAG